MKLIPNSGHGYRDKDKTPAPGPTFPEDLDFLQSDFFKLILKDPDGPKPTRIQRLAVKPAFFVHKELLASLSPELKKHVKNNMREGIEGQMHLGEVEIGTMKAFLCWAYRSDYQTQVNSNLNYWMSACSWADVKFRPMNLGVPEAILFHTKMYVLGDRFNITKLKDLTFSKVKSFCNRLGVIAAKGDADGMMEAVAYAYNELPFSVQQASSLPSPNVEEKLLVYLAKYTAWARNSLRTNQKFVNLLADCPQFAMALIYSLKTVPPPWPVSSVVDKKRKAQA